ncbi:hypothetical protein GLOIN_2v1121142 [Rhizophagus irregularis DAOM 181602=DAOM 197198]|uniref:Uncharacterized protein n=1 Tax=Rhizophagus irregularis (strain DAOM 181602 / DAOM 197198 / MUCL 43194) TaxID=747089 RepID=A0A2P4Q6R4_RHIID|nr:hypothetical protein GLOIN_2v1121142 [Rhizophagus irregularis DAOM 181602=DAOM 197198]POG73314.1 hypothetical protein GLOIN_2v1121142 [Rhizophagus irregularis DAOM 181602=DAOM 197198]|eukprot:XP_025180180.1 hypothetical protein GLOIN_2v1121142 [Rhizophagus irregularis DAOM 181602=DAOM 197198]
MVYIFPLTLLFLHIHLISSNFLIIPNFWYFSITSIISVLTMIPPIVKVIDLNGTRSFQIIKKDSNSFDLNILTSSICNS